MPTNLLNDYLNTEYLPNINNNKDDDCQGENKKITDMLTDLALILEDKVKLEGDYYYLQMEYDKLMQNMQETVQNHNEEKTVLFQRLQKKEDEIKIKELEETKLKEKEYMFNHEKKAFTIQIANLKEEVQKEKMERQGLEKRLLEEMKFLQDQLKNVLVDWLKTKDRCNKMKTKIKYKTKSFHSKNTKNHVKLQEMCHQTLNLDNKGSQTDPPVKTIPKGLQCRGYDESKVLEELFFRRKPFQYSLESFT